MNKQAKRIILSLFLFLFISELTTVSANNYYYIKKYTIKMRLNKNGIVDVNEIIDVYFYVKRHGILRWIPYKYNLYNPSAQYKNFILSFNPYITHKINIFNILVLNYQFTVSNDGTAVILKIGSPDKYITGNHTYIISYKVSDVILRHKDVDEFYWNPIGTEWDTEIKEAYIYFYMPQKLNKSEVKYEVYTGSIGSKKCDASVNFDGQTLSILHTNKALEPGEGITFKILFPINIINNNYIPFYNKATTFDFIKFFILPIIIFIISYIVWLKFGKEETITPVVQFLPPEDMTPIEAVSYIKERPDFQFLPLILYWGNKGYLKIGIDSNEKIYIKKLKEIKSRNDYENELFTGIFKFSDSEGKIYIDTLNMTKLVNKWNKEGIVKKYSVRSGNTVRYYLKKKKEPEQGDERNIYNYLFKEKDKVYIGDLEDCVKNISKAKRKFDNKIKKNIYTTKSRTGSIIFKILGAIIAAFTSYKMLNISIGFHSIIITIFIVDLLIFYKIKKNFLLFKQHKNFTNLFIGCVSTFFGIATLLFFIFYYISFMKVITLNFISTLLSIIWVVLLLIASQSKKGLIKISSILFIISVLLQITESPILLPALSLWTTSYILLLFGTIMVKRKKIANKFLEKALGFEEFVKKVDVDKLKTLDVNITEYFSKTLPYAVAFGYIKKWNKLFDGLLETPPSFMEITTGYSYLQLYTITSALESVSLTQLSTIPTASYTVSSSSSSSFSGGSSGGGFGGGGGSSW